MAQVCPSCQIFTPEQATGLAISSGLRGNVLGVGTLNGDRSPNDLGCFSFDVSRM